MSHQWNPELKKIPQDLLRLSPQERKPRLAELIDQTGVAYIETDKAIALGVKQGKTIPQAMRDFRDRQLHTYEFLVMLWNVSYEE